MNTARFDHLALTLAKEHTRRGTLSLLATGLAAGVFIRRTVEPARAQLDFRCLEGWTRCGDRCSKLTWDSLNCGWCGNVCPQGQVCLNRLCVNPPPPAPPPTAPEVAPW